MNINSFSLMLTVTIEAFAALMGISAALYLYLHQRYMSIINDVGKRVESNLRSMRQVFQNLNPDFMFNFPYLRDGRVPKGKHKTFIRMMEQIFIDYDDFLDQEVEIENGKRLARREIAQRVYEVETDLRVLEYVTARPHLPRVYYIILLVVCAVPIVYSFYNLLLMTYQIPLPSWSGIVLFVIDIACIVFFGVLSVIVSRSEAGS